MTHDDKVKLDAIHRVVRLHYNALDETGTMRNEIYVDLHAILLRYIQHEDRQTAKYAGWIMTCFPPKVKV